jgi:predicted unusual protein kinase regulating ubiquinone biosynthesis (AarF/ABC1/UbiB family)
VADGSIPTGRVARALPIAGLASASTLGRVAGWARRGGDAKELLRFTKEAQRLATTLGEMKGAAMKVGQLLSFVDSNLVPEAYRPIYHEIVGSLQADAPPIPTATVRAVIEEELGRPVDDVFAWFGEQPMAAASIGQVHAAHLPDGREVVVKVQYPGAAEAVRSDLANAELLASVGAQVSRVLGPLRPLSDPRAIVEEIRDRVQEELDYRVEAANLTLFADHYEGHPFIRIPRVHPELSTERVLVMDEADGLRYSAALEQSQELKDRWGEVINRFVWGSLYDLGAFNADPHPGNYLFHDDGGVSFIDFGCVKHFDDDEVGRMRELSDAALVGDGDPQALVEVLQGFGLLPADSKLAPERVLDWYRPMWEPVVGEQPFTFTPEFAAFVVERNFDPLGEFGDVVRGFSIAEQAKGYTFLTRIQLGLWSVLGALRTCGPWRAIHQEVLFGAEPATEVGHAHAAWKRERKPK